MQTGTDWEINATARQNALAFLDAHNVLPDMVAIEADGWVEAIYDYPVGDESVLKAWEAISEKTDIQMFKPMILVRNASGLARLRVQFNPNAAMHTHKQHKHTEPATQPSLWQRLKQLVS